MYTVNQLTLEVTSQSYERIHRYRQGRQIVKFLSKQFVFIFSVEEIHSTIVWLYLQELLLPQEQVHLLQEGLQKEYVALGTT